MILLVKDHVQGRSKWFYAKTKVNMFAKFCGRLELIKKKNFPCITVAVYFTSFADLTMCRNTHRAGCLSEKAYIITATFGSSELL